MTEQSPLTALRAALCDASFEHRVRTMLHRWYTAYDIDFPKPLPHHGELVTTGFVLHRAPDSGLPDVVGRDAYLAGLPHLYPGQANAHHLRSMELTRTAEGTAKAVVTHDFETAGPALNGAAVIRYDLSLVDEPGEWLPRISALTEQVLSQHEAPFADAFGENRVRAFLHYWLSLLEQPTPTAEPLRELLADDLAMTISDDRVLRTFDEVAAWYGTAREAVDISTHHVQNLVITPAPNGAHDLAMDLQWQGITKNGQPMVAHTRHRWTLRESGDRYLRLARFVVTHPQPFTPVPAQEALARFEEARNEAS